MRVLFWIWLLSVQLAAESRLHQLLRQQQQEYAGAVVTSGFYDARGVSRYRANPGLHSGYDIAMPAGSRARAAWPGRVRAIIPWADGEWGVQVVHQDGTTATYGHIVPTVECGRELGAGQVVGLIARDHLDVKMRDVHGRLFDYADSMAVEIGSVRLQPPVVGPSARALEWQERWRAFSRRPPLWLSAEQRRLLAGQGLARAGSEQPDLALLRADFQRLSRQEQSALSWRQEDAEAARAWRTRWLDQRKRLELGLVAPKRVHKLREISDFWSEVLQSGKRTVAGDESFVGGRRTGRAGLAAQAAADGGI
ncbi:MAG: M23 family metallopeptidase [Vulcanimicrobiota bacterium]